MRRAKTIRLTATLAWLWLLCLPLVQGALANGSDHFLERLASETRDGRLVVSVYFVGPEEFSVTPADSSRS